MKLKQHKKGDVNYFITIIFISILSFFVILFYLQNVTDTVATQTEDLVCRALVETKEKSKLGVGFFMYELSNKCRVDKIKIDLNNKKESFEKLGEEQIRCWERYGSGKVDFLSEYNAEGNWCFLCGVLEYEGDPQSITYKEYVEWSATNYPPIQKEKERLSYFNKTNMIYSDVSDEEILEIRSEFRNLLIESEKIEAHEKPLFEAFANNLEYVTDLKTRQLNSEDEKAFVVYRFDRVNKDRVDVLSDAGKYAFYGTLASIGAALILEGAVEAAVIGGASALTRSATIIGGPICGLVGGVYGFIKGAGKAFVKSSESFDRLSKLNALVGRLSNMVKKGTSSLNYERLKIGSKSFKAYKKVEDFKASPDDLRNFAQGLEKSADQIKDKDLNGIANNFRFIADYMESSGIKNLDEIDNLVLRDKKDIEGLEKILNKEGFSPIWEATYKDWELLGNNVDDIEALRTFALSEISAFKAGNKVEMKATLHLNKLLIVGGTGGLVGAGIGGLRNENNQQYIDVLTREQYYRLCGTQRSIS